MRDPEELDLFLQQVMDRYTAAELVDLLDIPIWKIVDAFYDEVIDAGRELLDS